jgi:hypothetical protein
LRLAATLLDDVPFPSAGTFPHPQNSGKRGVDILRGHHSPDQIRDAARRSLNRLRPRRNSLRPLHPPQI